MNDAKLKALVTSTCAKDREVRALAKLVTSMKAEIAAEATSRPEEQLKTDGGGWSWTLAGNDGNVCRVTKPGDSLKASIDDDGKSTPKIRAAAGPHFTKLFVQAPKWKLVPDFREAAAALLGKGAVKLIKLVSGDTKIKVSFETKDAEEGGEE